jgi:tetratricopeptide (TPR) repeat protein
LPPTDESTLDLRLVAVDLAGNVASVELPGVKLPRAPQDAAPVPLATQPAPLQPSAPAAQPSAPIPDEAQRLRRMAGEFLAQGRFPLAVARLEDALVLAPTDPDLLTELGTALYRAGRYDDANRRFQAALANAPQHPAALDGLALVAVTQRQYSQAREYLEQLQRLRPNSGLLWLRSGDVEHRLGNTARALAAWRKALNAEDGDPDAQASARRRLEYFGSLSAAETQPASSQPWHEPRPSRPSSSSMAMTSTKKPSR